MRGCDFATALLYDRIRREPPIAEFIAAIDALRRDEGPVPSLRGKVLVAPAAFHRELPQFGGDGRAITEIARRFGLTCELLPSESAGSVTRNAELIREALDVETDEPFVLVSLSKGAADLRLALESAPRALAHARAWVQIGGLVRGSPIVDAILASPVRRSLLRAYLAYLRADLSVCSQLVWRENPLLSGRVSVPNGLEVINVVGFPLACHLSGNTKRRYLEMRRFGPNDGSTLLVDAIVESGVVYPVWGADHYFRIPGVANLLVALFRYLATRWPR
jgi:hypothetical protein